MEPVLSGNNKGKAQAQGQGQQQQQRKGKRKRKGKAPDHQTDISTSSGGEVSNSKYDIPPALFSKFDVNQVDALVVSPQQPGSDEEKLEVQFSIDWRPQAHHGGEAYFRLRYKVNDDNNNILFLFIPPERVYRLSVDPEPDVKKPSSSSSYKNVVALSFHMASRLFLVVPKPKPLGSNDNGPSARPAQEPAQESEPELEHIIAPLRRLASQPLFTVYANIPPRVLRAAEIRRLCAAVSAHNVSTTAHHGLERILPTLYAGHGGQALDLAALQQNSSSASASAVPPSYDHALATSSRTAYAHDHDHDHHNHPSPSIPPRKRRRLDDSPPPAPGLVTDDDAMGRKQQQQQQPVSLADVAKLIDARLSIHLREIRNMHSAFTSGVSEMLTAHKAEILAGIASSEGRVTDTVKDKMPTWSTRSSARRQMTYKTKSWSASRQCLCGPI